MLHFRRTFETEKLQLQELNGRLGHYLSRTKQLEQDNACLISEINKLKQQKTLEWENQYKKEMRELRNTVGLLSFEKSQAEMERERLWREFQMLQSMCCEETVVRKDIGGELKGCEKQLQQAHKKNESLEERLFQLENEHAYMEDAHKQEIAHLRSQVQTRVVPMVTQKFHTAVSMEEVQEYARSVSEGWIDTFEMYQQRLDEMEESIRADQARMADLQREKMLHVSELEKLRAEAEKQSQIQIDLEDQCMHMQDSFREDVNEYQITIEQLEQERAMLADSMAERVREHQELLQVKMDLGMEVAAYRALLEAERIDAKEVHTRANQHQRERIIDIKMPSQPYTPRTSASTRQDLRRHLEVRYMEPTSILRRSPPLRPTSPPRVIPISISGRAAHQSPAARRDMVAFAKASQAAAVVTSTSKPVPQSVATTTNKPVAQTAVTSSSKPVAQSAASITSEAITQSASSSTSEAITQSSSSSTSEAITQSSSSITSEAITQSSSSSTSEAITQSASSSTSEAITQSASSSTSKAITQSSSSITSKPITQSADERSPDTEKKVLEEKSVKPREVPQKPAEVTFSPIPSATADPGSVRVVSPPMMSLGESPEEDSKTEEEVVGATKGDVSVRVMSEASEREAGREEGGDAYGMPKSTEASSEKKVLDCASMEQIIEKFMRPAGLDATLSSPGDPKVTYHVEKTEQEDGTVKTQIILESKMEEELDLSQDDALEELLSTGVKKISLEDIKGTPTGSMIESLLSLGIAGELGNKSVNVEIIEEPMDSQSDEEYEDEDEVRSMPKFSQPSSRFFQIEELENVPQDSQRHESGVDVMTTTRGSYSSVQVQDDSRDTESHYLGLDQESQEYFVSSPDPDISDPEEGGITSYGRYGVVDDLSDERYYQEGGLTASRTFEDDGSSYTFMTSDHSFVRESFPEIIEEEMPVSPTAQESMLGGLREDRHPQEQLRGALEQLQGSTSTSLEEELSLLTRAESESPQNLAVDVKKVQQSSDNGAMTIVAELNVSQSLEDFAVTEEGGRYVRVSRDQDVRGAEGFASSTTEVTEKHIKLGPTEKSFTFQMDVNSAQSQGVSRAEGGQFVTEGAGFGRALQSQMMDPPLRVTHEKRIATVYLESSNDQ